MGFGSVIQTMDRLSVHSVTRGSTSTLCGILGTLILLGLCLGIYIPPAIAYLNGNYYESEFISQDKVDENFYSNRDFKIAIQFRHRSNNSVADHKAMFDWAYIEFFEYLGDRSDYWIEEPALCRKDYFDDTINPVELEDCFIFPENSLFDAFADIGWYTDYTNIFFWLYPQEDDNPFSGTFGSSQYLGYELLMHRLLDNYYYTVYFTSQLVDPATGKEYFKLNRYYSSDNDFTQQASASNELLIYSLKHYYSDISIMPWRNNITKSTLVWLGESHTLTNIDPLNAAANGVQVSFSLYKFGISSYRYYKKLDWLLGIIGGAMLLFYIILWVPCNYIAKTMHQISNAEKVLLLNHSNDEPLTEEHLFPAYVSKWFWLSNPVLDCCFPPTRNASKMVAAAEHEVDIVSFLKKMKVIERNLKKKALLEPFKPKVLKMKSTKVMVVVEDIEEAESSVDGEGNRELRAQQEVVEEIVEEDFIELPVDDTSGLTDVQQDALVSEPRMREVYENHMVANALRNDKDQTLLLKEMEDRSRYKANFESKRKVKTARKAINCLARLFRAFDFFGTRPNLIAEPYNSSFLGCLVTLLIVGLSILTFALTLKNAGVSEMMINNQVLQEKDIEYELVTGKSLKFALCLSQASSLRGTIRKANLRFFTESKEEGRKYYQPTALSSADYELFDLTEENSPINLNYCFAMPPEVEVEMGADRLRDYGYFGFRIEPYCVSSAAYCQANKNIINDDFLTVINTTGTYLMLPENRFDPNTTTFVNNLVLSQLNINYRYMNNETAMEETVEVDHVRIMDDTQNWFMRKQATVKFQGIASNENLQAAITRNIISYGSPYYEARVRPSEKRIDYQISTKKADTILAIIGGIFVLWYAVLHWLGKVYNIYQVRFQLAYDVYYQESNEESVFKKIVALSPLPTCMIPSCCQLQNDVRRMRQIDKKIQNDLHYLYLVRNVDTLFHLSSALFERLQAKNLSLVFVKEKIDESERIVAPVQVEEIDHVQDADFMNNDDLEEVPTAGMSENKVLNQSSVVPEPSYQNLKDTTDKMLVRHESSEGSDGNNENFQDNYVHGLPKQPRFNWLDTFQYPAGFSFNGKREVTSCCGGCACLILMMFIIIIANFEVGIYLNRSDTKIGKSTEMMQPLEANSNSTYNSQIHLTSGQNFKLAVTFAKKYYEYPHNVSNWTNSAVGISIFQEVYTFSSGQMTTQTIEVPLVPCSSDYFTGWLNELVDPAYYQNIEKGYCIPDGITLEIDGIPQDPVVKRFSLSIFNKLKTTAGNVEIKEFMKLYSPKFHVSNPQVDFKEHKFDYTMNSFSFTSFDLTSRVRVNVSLSRVVVRYDDSIDYSADPYEDINYSISPFQQEQSYWMDSQVDAYMSYNISFANSFQVQYYTVTGDKFYETFGIIGGLVAIFIFGLGCCARSFNQYRTRYLIGRELYLFDILRKNHARAMVRGRKKSRDQLIALSDANKMSEGEVLWAYISSFPASFVGNFNLNSILRRVTLIQRRVEQDLSLFEILKKIHNMRDILNKQFPFSKCPISDIQFKHIYNPEPYEQSLTGQPRILSFAKKHNWSSFEQFAVFDAARASINLKAVFDNSFLEKEFNLEGLDRTQVHMSQFGGTQGSVGTNSIGSLSEGVRQDEDEEERRK